MAYKRIMGADRTALDRWMAGQPRLKLTELAREVGISQGYLSRLRSGKRRPGPALAAKLAARTGIGVLELLGLGEESGERRRADGH